MQIIIASSHIIVGSPPLPGYQRHLQSPLNASRQLECPPPPSLPPTTTIPTVHLPTVGASKDPCHTSSGNVRVKILTNFSPRGIWTLFLCLLLPRPLCLTVRLSFANTLNISIFSSSSLAFNRSPSPPPPPWPSTLLYAVSLLIGC